MKGRDIHGITFLVILCNASMKRNGQSSTTYTLLYTYRDILKWNDVTCTYARHGAHHSLIERNTINLKRSFKENIIKKYLLGD